MLLALVLLLVAFLLFERFRGQIALANYKKELLAQGEKLSPQDFVAKFAEADNGAPQVISAIERLQRGTVMPHNPPPRMRLVLSGRAIVGFREPVWVDKGTFREGKWVNETTTNHWAALAADLTTNQAVLAEIRAGLAKPVFNNQVDLREGMKMKLQHLAPLKSLAPWLGATSALALHEGKTQDALPPLLLQVQLPRTLAADHILISELVRIAIAAIAKESTWEALQADGWQDADLAQLQAAWQDQKFLTAMTHGLEGERVFGDVSAEMIRCSNENAISAIYGLQEMFGDADDEAAWWRKWPGGESVVRFWRHQVYCRVWRFAWSHQEQRRYLEKMQELFEIAREAEQHKSYTKAAAALDGFAEGLVNRNFYAAWRFPGPEYPGMFPHAIKRAMRMETERSLTLTAIALQRHFIHHGNYPAELDALIPEFLSSVPVDYMDGQPIKYRLNGDGTFALYSVGDDGRDDGGDLSLQPEKTRLRVLWDRKDYVWPAPATPEEVAEYRRQAGRN